MEEEDEFTLSKEELEVFYEVLFKRIMEIMKQPDVDIDPFREMVTILSRLSGIFSFKSMVSLIPELVSYAVRYGMLVEKAYEEEQLNLKEDLQGVGSKEEQKRRISKIQEDMDKISLYL